MDISLSNLHSLLGVTMLRCGLRVESNCESTSGPGKMRRQEKNHRILEIKEIYVLLISHCFSLGRIPQNGMPLFLDKFFVFLFLFLLMDYEKVELSS